MKEKEVVRLADAAESANMKRVYRVEGFTCVNCAGKFEDNVKRLPGVQDAIVNFGASKITVFGYATIEELERAGAFENLRVKPDDSPEEAGSGGMPAEKEPFLKKHRKLMNAVFMLVLGYVSWWLNGEQNFITILLFAVSIVIGGFSLFRTGLKNLARLEFDMKTLMTVAISGAAIIGEWAEGAVVVILFAISESLERFSMERARKSIRSLMEMAPKEALIRKDGREIKVPAKDIAVGDIMIVKPGDKIAMDGVVVAGRSVVNQSAITGESVPTLKTAGDEVYAGTLNGEGLLEVRVTKQFKDTALVKIMHLVEEAQVRRAPSQAFIDKFAKYYTPAVMAVSALVAFIPPLLAGENWETWIYQGLSVLVVGCPCALVISAPVSIVSAIGNAAKNGVLLKGGIYLEELGALKAVAFDKTGTLTKGVSSVTDFAVIDRSRTLHDALAVIAALESRSQHPLASAMTRKAEQENVAYADMAVDDFVSVTGKGVQGTINGIKYFVGSLKWLEEDLQIPAESEQKLRIQEWQNQGKTVMAASTETRWIAVFATADEVRESASEVIRKLHRMGIRKTVMLTGDHWRTARAIAGQLRVSEVKAELMPKDKLTFIQQLRKQYGKAAMVGDGVNDAPALAASTVGIAMGGAGTDTAIETADVVLMSDDLGKLPFAIKLSRKAVRIIRQNVVLALILKLAALLLVVPGWLTLWIAIVSDMGATLLVTLNGLRLLKEKE
jgi:Cd2+/Zn2+-exporting ATPase